VEAPPLGERPVRRARISVVVPVHDGERWLADALESIAAQTYPDVETVVVDDGSTRSLMSRRIHTDNLSHDEALVRESLFQSIRKLTGGRGEAG